MSKRKRRPGKICTKCKTFKTFSNFGKHKEGTFKEPDKIRVNSWCIECHREYAREQKRVSGYKTKHAAYMREYRRRVKEKSVIK